MRNHTLEAKVAFVVEDDNTGALKKLGISAAQVDQLMGTDRLDLA